MKALVVLTLTGAWAAFQGTPTIEAAQSGASSPQLLPVPYPSVEGMEPVVARQLERLRERLQTALDDGRADGSTFGEAGRNYHAYELLAPAEVCYRNAQGLDPGNFRWPYLLALLLEQDNRLEDAASSLQIALAGPKQFYPAFVRLAKISLALGRMDDAEAALTPARQHAPDDPALLAVEAELALARDQPEKALKHLTRALQAQPRATRLHYPLGMALRALRRMDEARQHLAQAGSVGVRPRDPLLEGVLSLRRGERVHLQDGHKAFRAGDALGAAEAYRRAVEATGATNVGPLLNLAAAEAQLGRHQDAIHHLRQAHRVAPDEPRTLYNLGVMLAHVGQPAEALPLLRRLAANAPEDEPAQVALSLTLLAADVPEEALDTLATITHLEPSRCAELMTRLGVLKERPNATYAARANAAAQRFVQIGACPPQRQK